MPNINAAIISKVSEIKPEDWANRTPEGTPYALYSAISDEFWDELTRSTGCTIGDLLKGKKFEEVAAVASQSKTVQECVQIMRIPKRKRPERYRPL